jgi:hypothetical protein
VWQTPYQGAPLDFGGRDFYRARRTIIDKRIAEISKMSKQDVAKAVGESWD